MHYLILEDVKPRQINPVVFSEVANLCGILKNVVWRVDHSDLPTSEKLDRAALTTRAPQAFGFPLLA